MEKANSVVPGRLSRIAVIKDREAIILNDLFLIHFLRHRSFLVAWNVCKAVATDEKVQTLGGVPPKELRLLCEPDRVHLSIADLTTLWHDEIEYRRHEQLRGKLYEVHDLKSGGQLLSLPGKEVAGLLQVIFGRRRVPGGSGLHRNTKLFAINGLPEQVSVFRTTDEALQAGISSSGVTEITRYRRAKGDVGILDWRHTVKIDAEGNTTSELNITVANLSSHPLVGYPVFVQLDAPQGVVRTLVACDADGQRLMIEPVIGKETSRITEVIIKFPRPIPIGEVTSFLLQYAAKGIYKKGKEWFNWYFDHPHAQYDLRLEFAPTWRISAPVAFAGEVEDVFPVHQPDEHTLEWRRLFPELGKTYRIEFLLSLQHN